MSSSSCVVESLSRPGEVAPVLGASPGEVTRLTSPGAARWDAYVLAHDDATLFHTVAWREAVKDAFGHEDVYLAVRRGGRIVGVLPLFLVRGVLTLAVSEPANLFLVEEIERAHFESL